MRAIRSLLAVVLFGCPLPAETDSGDTETDTVAVDADADGYDVVNDCDDSDPAIHPDAVETCNGRDDDCDRSVDEGIGVHTYLDSDGDGYGNDVIGSWGCSTPTGFVARGGDCDDNNSTANPEGSEVCDDEDVDEDCDGLADDGDPSVQIDSFLTWFVDPDLDGHAGEVASVGPASCDGGLGVSVVRDDCAPEDATVFPGAIEEPNQVDDDCDDAIDECGLFGGLYWGTIEWQAEVGGQVVDGCASEIEVTVDASADPQLRSLGSDCGSLSASLKDGSAAAGGFVFWAGTLAFSGVFDGDALSGALEDVDPPEPYAPSYSGTLIVARPSR